MICQCTRRVFVLAPLGAVVATHADAANEFVAAAFRMKEHAIATGDQPYGAVVVQAGNIIGWGPSRSASSANRQGTPSARRYATRSEGPAATIFPVVRCIRLRGLAAHASAPPRR